MKNEKEVEVSEVPGSGIELSRTEPESSALALQTFDLTNNLPSLANADEIPLDLVSDYWTPEREGEAKKVFFVKVEPAAVLDQETGARIDLECAFFLERSDDGQVKQIRNGSKRLVGALVANQIRQGTPLLITYLGKKKNRTNSFKSDSWSIKPLRVNIG